MGKKHHRKGYRDKNGVWHQPTWVRGKNPAPGCNFWMIGIIGLGALVANGARRARRKP